MTSMRFGICRLHDAHDVMPLRRRSGEITTSVQIIQNRPIKRRCSIVRQSLHDNRFRLCGHFVLSCFLGSVSAII